MENKRLPQFEDCHTLEQMTGGDYLASRSLAAYSSTKQGIVLKDLRNNQCTLISGGGKNEKCPRFSPCGEKLLFLSQQEDTYCIVIYHLDTKTSQICVRFSSPVAEPIWSPDGSKILFASTISNTASEAADTGSKPLIIKELGYKFDGLGFRTPDNATHLFVADTAACEAVPQRITSGNYDYLHHNWCPDSNHVICVSNKFRPGEEYLGYDLLHIDINSREIRKLTEGLWLVSYPSPVRPVCTPDGRYVIAGVMDEAYAKTISTGTFPETYLYRIAMDGSSCQQIFFPDSQCYQCTQFPYNAVCGMNMDKLQISEDGKYAYFHGGWQGQAGLFKLKIFGDGHAEPLDRGKHAYNGISPVHDGKFLAAKCSDTLPEGYYLLDADTGAVLSQVVQSAADYIEAVKLSTPEDFFVPALDGSTNIHGWVLPPQNMKPGEKYPAILYIHGGPHPFYTYALTMEHQCFAANGFGVICCNPRGSSGYGWQHQNMGDARTPEPYYDCLQFVDEAVRRYPWIDADRLGVTGGSYGGYMTGYIAIHAKRFQAYIMQRGLPNEQIMYGSSDETGRSKDESSFPHFMMENIKKSCVAYAEKIDKPLLILHGEKDCRTPVEAARQLYTAVKDLHADLPVKLVLVPNTGHSQPRDPALQQEYYQHMVDWFKKYL